MTKDQQNALMLEALNKAEHAYLADYKINSDKSDMYAEQDNREEARKHRAIAEEAMYMAHATCHLQNIIRGEA